MTNPIPPEVRRGLEALSFHAITGPEAGAFTRGDAKALVDYFAEVEAAASRAPQGQVGVKALVWREEARGLAPGEMIADTPFGPYRVGRYGRFWAVYFNDNLVTEQPSDADAAKRAAQADYEQRILSALANGQDSGEREGLLVRLTKVLTEDAPDKWVWKDYFSLDEWVTGKLLPLLRDLRAALSHPDPVAPQGTGGDIEVDVFTAAVKLLEDAGWKVIDPRKPPADPQPQVVAPSAQPSSDDLTRAWDIIKDHDISGDTEGLAQDMALAFDALRSMSA